MSEYEWQGGSKQGLRCPRPFWGALEGLRISVEGCLTMWNHVTPILRGATWNRLRGATGDRPMGRPGSDRFLGLLSAVQGRLGGGMGMG